MVKPLVIALACLLALSSCAGPKASIPKLSPITREAMHERFKEGIPPSLRTSTSERTGLARRAQHRIHAAAVRACQRIFQDGQNCLLDLSRYRVRVRPNDPTVNAHIDINSNITVYGGLIRLVGSEDELAAVLAHEYSHGLMRHLRKKLRNMAIGGLIGLAAGATVGAAAKEPDSIRTGTDIGIKMGSLVYSQSMENEADHLGLFILHEAGYNTKSASHFFMRMLHARKFVRRSPKGTVPFYFKTHPPYKERIQKIVATEAMIEQGHTSPIWKRR